MVYAIIPQRLVMLHGSDVGSRRLNTAPARAGCRCGLRPESALNLLSQRIRSLKMDGVVSRPREPHLSFCIYPFLKLVVLPALPRLVRHYEFFIPQSSMSEAMFTDKMPQTDRPNCHRRSLETLTSRKMSDNRHLRRITLYLHLNFFDAAQRGRSRRRPKHPSRCASLLRRFMGGTGRQEIEGCRIRRERTWMTDDRQASLKGEQSSSGYVTGCRSEQNRDKERRRDQTMDGSLGKGSASIQNLGCTGSKHHGDNSDQEQERRTSFGQEDLYQQAR
jgi:hypothetical protein